MLTRGTRANIRNIKDFDIKLVGKGGTVGEIEEISWAPMAGDQEDGMIPVGLSLKIKKLNERTKLTPKDLLQLTIHGRASNARFAQIAESIQNLKFAPITIDGKTQDIPEEFEENLVYSYKGYTLVSEE